MSKVAIIGGGAAGMMAAIAAAEGGHQVTLFEHNEKLGKKLYITGKGRCNLTNACPAEELFDAFSRNPKFLYSAVYQFDNRAVMEFFESCGLHLKVERGNRVFPVSDHSSDVIKALSETLRRLGVKVCLHAEVTELLVSKRAKGNPKEESDAAAGAGKRQSAGQGEMPSGNPQDVKSGQRLRGVKYVSTDKGKTDTEQTFLCDTVILATGGVSYASTGSDGSGFELIKPLGHTCTALRPSLIGMCTREPYIPALQGLTLKNISFTVKSGKKLLYKDFGELLFTHQGISGPLVLTASSVIPDMYFRGAETGYGDFTEPENKKKPVCDLDFEIDLKASLREEQLDKRIQRDFSENSNRQFKNSLGKLLPAKLIPVVIRLSGIDPEKKVNSVSRAERQELLRVLKHFPGTITGLGDIHEAIITRGGVPVKELDPSTMESKLVSGLYLCGEMLDVDAVTGGFNLQIAWSTGHLAGSSVRK